MPGGPWRAMASSPWVKPGCARGIVRELWVRLSESQGQAGFGGVGAKAKTRGKHFGEAAERLKTWRRRFIP